MASKKKGDLVFATDLVRGKGEMLYIEGKEGEQVIIRSTPANRKGGTKGRCVLERGGQPTKHPCSSRLKALGGGPKPRKKAKKSAKRTAAKRPAKRTAKRSAKRTAKRTARRAVGYADVTTRQVGRTRRRRASGAKTGFAAMPKAERVRLAKKGARAAAKARGGARRRR